MVTLTNSRAYSSNAIGELYIFFEILRQDCDAGDKDAPHPSPNDNALSNNDLPILFADAIAC